MSEMKLIMENWRILKENPQQHYVNTDTDFPKKNTPFAAAQAAEKAAAEAMSRGLSTIEVRIKGPGAGREAAVRALMTSGLNVSTIMDLTPIPHNGCRPPKKRRV